MLAPTSALCWGLPLPVVCSSHLGSCWGHVPSNMPPCQARRYVPRINWSCANCVSWNNESLDNWIPSSCLKAIRRHGCTYMQCPRAAIVRFSQLSPLPHFPAARPVSLVHAAQQSFFRLWTPLWSVAGWLVLQPEHVPCSDVQAHGNSACRINPSCSFDKNPCFLMWAKMTFSHHTP